MQCRRSNLGARLPSDQWKEDGEKRARAEGMGWAKTLNHLTFLGRVQHFFFFGLSGFLTPDALGSGLWRLWTLCSGVWDLDLDLDLEKLAGPALSACTCTQ